MTHFNETFADRIGVWLQQNVDNASPAEIEASGADALKAQQIIEAAIESWDQKKVVTLR